MEFHQRPFKIREFKIEVTHKCPLACLHCSSDATPSSTMQITRKDCLRILRDASKMGAKEVAFSGGEPLLWRALEEAVGVAASYGFRVVVYTSGNVQNIYNQMKKLAKAGANSCVFSIFGANPVSHERITRIGNSFLKTKHAISAAKQNNLETEFHFVPFSNNYNELDAIAGLAGKLGITKISVLRFVPQGRGALIQGRTLDKIQNIQLKRSITRLRSQGFDVRTGSPYNFLMLNDQPKCSSGIDRLIIGPDLRIFPCDAFKQVMAEEIAGTLKLSMLKDYSLEECWSRSPFLEAIRGYLTTDFAEPCASCDALVRCLSGCLAQKVIANGNLKKRPDPMCLLTQVRQ